MSIDEEMIQRVWGKGTIASNNDPNLWRKDKCGAWMYKPAHRDRNSEYGWEIHHIDPNGGGGLENLKPLLWENNLATGDTGKLICVVIAYGNKNVRKRSMGVVRNQPICYNPSDQPSTLQNL